jgi:hypothetical protein
MDYEQYAWTYSDFFRQYHNTTRISVDSALSIPQLIIYGMNTVEVDGIGGIEQDPDETLVKEITVKDGARKTLA